MEESNTYQDELRNFIPHFMHELDGLLKMNSTNEIKIEGLYYSYYILCDVKQNIILVKESKKDKKVIRYSQKKEEFDDGNFDKKLIKEFYNLFVQKTISQMITKMYNLMSDTDDITFSPKTISEDSYFWTIKKIQPSYIIIQRSRIDNEKEYELILKKISKIPNWFIISKDETFCVENVNRLLTFFKADPDQDLFYFLGGVSDAQKKQPPI